MYLVAPQGITDSEESIRCRYKAVFPTPFPTQENIILSSGFPRISSDSLGPLGIDALFHLSLFTRDGLLNLICNDSVAFTAK